MLPRFELMVAAGRSEAAGPRSHAETAKALMSQPIALAPPPTGRAVIGQVSAAAEAFAVTPGLAVGEAFARCPQLKLVPPDPAAAATGWEWVLQAVEGIGAEVESDPDAPGTLFFESAGLEPLHRGFDGVIAAVRDAIGRPVRIGSAQTRFVALAAARTARPRRPRIIRNDFERREFLANAPVAWLGLFSKQCEELAATLDKLGIETLGEFAVLRRAQIAERFGRIGLTARDLVHGQEPPLRPRKPSERLSERIDLIDDAEGQGSHARGAMSGDLERALTLLIERLVARPERAGRTLRGFSLNASFVEGGSWSTRALMREPTADPMRIKLVLERKLLELPEPASALGLTALGFGPLDHQVMTLIDDDSDEERSRRLKVASEQARQAAGSPEKVARVVRMNEGTRLPERRAALSPGPVPLGRPRPAQLRADRDGVPIALRGRPVTHERERWVVEDRWWTASPVRRRYFEVVLDGGSNAVVFQDLRSGRWFEQWA